MALLKKKAAAFGLAFLIALSAMGMTAQAFVTPQTVRIGLDSAYKNVSAINIGNEAIALGSEVNGIYQEVASFLSQGGFSVTPAQGMTVMLTESYFYQDAAKVAQELNNYGFIAVPGFNGNGFTVYVSGASAEQVKVLSGRSAKVTDKNTASMMELRGNGRTLAIIPGSVSTQIIAKDQNGVLLLGQTKYRGRIEVSRTSTGINAINVVGLEEYLYGVVPKEMPASYELEALKAQAVAARTYAVKRLGSHNGSNYQLCDNIHCQVYKGLSGENERSTKAVADTAGQILIYQNAPIDAVFSASSGGYTENSENVWQNEVSYLKGKPELNEVGALEWEKTISLSDLDSLLAKNGENIGNAVDLVIGKISSGGRVQELRIVGTSGEKVLTKESVRTYFSGAPSGSFPSKLFKINGKGGTQEANPDNMEETVIRDVNISTKDGSGLFVISGKGNGHGCGLSQMGAQGMALLGKGYDEILHYYYTGVTIEPKQENNDENS